MILDISGNPVFSYVAPSRSEELERDLTSKLSQLDPAIAIKWFDTAWWNDHNKQFEGRYAVIYHWPPDAAIYELYQSGKTDAPYDIIGWLCTDKTDASSIPISLDGLFDHVRRILAECDNTHRPWRERVSAVMRGNQEMSDKREADLLDETEQMAKHYAKLVATSEPIVNIPMQLQHTPATKKEQ